MDGNKKVGITQSRCRAYYPRRCKRIRFSVTIESIPDELLFEILVHLPAQDIYHAARLVCKKWNHIIRDHDFVRTHLEQTSYGLLFQEYPHGVYAFVSVREGEVEARKLKDSKFRGLMWTRTSCNGLVLLERKKRYVIANLSTDEAFRLSYPRTFYHPCAIGIGYVAASMTYKVFATHCALWGESVGIFTVGVDKSWRVISTHHLSRTAKGALFSRPLINEGFMHWKRKDTQVVTLNVETEAITETPPPIQERTSIYCFPTGKYLSLMISHGELVWEVWEMKPETGEWRKLPEMLCLQGQKGRMEGLGLKEGDRIIPCGWVKYLEVLALKIVGNCGASCFVCFYNLVKREISSEKVMACCNTEVILHKNNLISPGC